MDLQLASLIDDIGLVAHTISISHLISRLNVSKEQIELVCSSGSSVVIIFKDEAHPYVYQHYFDANTYGKIVQLCHDVQMKSNCIFDISVNERGNNHTITNYHVNYDLRDYLVSSVDFWPEYQTIVWEKIIPIRQLPRNYVIDHIDQLIWDVGLALMGLHEIGYVHSDSRLDNIGYKNGKFILFDYNLSVLCRDIKNRIKDFRQLGISIVDQYGSNYLVPQGSDGYKLFLLDLCRHNKFNMSDQLTELKNKYEKKINISFKKNIEK